MDETLPTHIDGNENPSTLSMKVLSSGKRSYIVDNILHDLYGGKFKP